MSSLSRLIFFGTPTFALPSLQALVEAGLAPLMVVARPARPAGRGHQLRQPPVAQWAQEHGLPLRQPERVREERFVEELRALEPDLAVVVAFGQIFPTALLALPRQGCVNVHASLLPRHRGAAPVQAALRSGDPVTGVTTMVMDEGLDTGPILLTAETRLSGYETAGELAPRLAHLGASLLLETLGRLQVAALEPTPQPEAGATVARRLTRDDGRAQWALPARRLFDLYRAVTPWPGLHTELRGRPLRILGALPLAKGSRGEPPGTLLGLSEGRLEVACGEGSVLGLERLQRPGRRPVSARELAHGEGLQAGEELAPAASAGTEAPARQAGSQSNRAPRRKGGG